MAQLQKDAFQILVSKLGLSSLISYIIFHRVLSPVKPNFQHSSVSEIQPAENMCDTLHSLLSTHTHTHTNTKYLFVHVHINFFSSGKKNICTLSLVVFLDVYYWIYVVSSLRRISFSPFHIILYFYFFSLLTQKDSPNWIFPIHVLITSGLNHRT